MNVENLSVGGPVLKKWGWLVVAIAIGCATNKAIPPTTVVSGFDLRRFAQRGFLFSPEPYNGQFDALGFVAVTQYDGVQWSNSSEQWELIPVSTADVLDSVYSRSLALGADALVRMEVRAVESPGTEKDWRIAGTPPHSVPGIQVSGWAIKRR